MDELTTPDDAACRRCGYSLRGLPTSDNCPECGEPIANSLRSDLLRDADPKWFRAIEIGMTCLAASVICGVVMPGAFALATLGVAGICFATAADPRRPTSSRPMRYSIRALLVVGAALMIAASFARWQSAPSIATPLDMAGQVIAACGFSVFIRYLGHLAQRLPDAELATRSRPIAWAVGGGMSVYIVLNTLGGGRSIDQESSAGAVLAFSFTMILSPLLGIAIIAGLVMAIRFTSKLHAESLIVQGLVPARAESKARR